MNVKVQFMSWKYGIKLREHLMKKKSLPIDFDPELYLELNHDVRDAGVK